MDNLEGRDGYSLVVAQRDFVVGATIYANILNAIKSSNCVTMILSRYDIHCRDLTFNIGRGRGQKIQKFIFFIQAPQYLQPNFFHGPLSKTTLSEVL